MTKKIISLILVTVLCLAMGNMIPVSAAEDEGFLYKMQFLSSLKICDTKSSTHIVSRGEFVSMVIHALCIEHVSQDSGFKDVKEDHIYKKEIDNAKEAGLIQGVGTGEFYPDRAIDYVGAVKILIQALGYEKMAVVLGNYPTGYIIAASNLNLTKGVAVKEGSLFFEDAVKLIYNALYTDLYLVKGIKGDEITYQNESGKNLLTEKFSLTLEEGIIESSGYFSISGGGVKGKMAVGDMLLGVNGDYKDAVGKKAKVWYDSATNTMVAVDIDKRNTDLTINADEILDKDGFSLKCENKTYNLDRGYLFLKNGRGVIPSDKDFEGEKGYFILTDNNGDKLYDIVKFFSPEYIFVQGVNPATKVIYDTSVLNLEDDSERDVYFYGGVFEDISEKSVLTVYKSEDGRCSEVYISSDSVKGEITELWDDNIKIGDTQYKVNDRFMGAGVGDNGTFYLAHDKSVAGFEDGEGSMKYGFLLDSMKDDGVSGNVYVRILGEDGKKVNYTVSKNVTIDSEIKSDNDLYRCITSGGAVDYCLIRYAVDSEGKINAFDRAKDKSGETDINEKYRKREGGNDSLQKYLSKELIWYYQSPDAGAPNFIFGSSVIFSVPVNMEEGKRYSEDMFSVITTADLVSSTSYTVDVYDYSENFIPGAICIYASESTDDGKYVAVPSRSAESYVVTSVVSAEYDGNITKKIYAYGGDFYSGFTVSPDYIQLLTSSGRIPEKGDIVRFAFDSEGLISGISRDVKYKERNLSVSYGKDGVNNAGNGSITYVTGKAFSVSEDVLGLMVKDFPPTVTSYPAPADGIAAFNVSKLTNIVIYDSKTSQVRRALISDIVPMRSSLDDASLIAVRTSYSEPKIIVIYR